ncbi:MAG: MATE family efflux transporter [Candidatus Marinimicrobia bacterium]|nr:MATE family efflux transporter [Candidatus Neomarinimicrobiota bacterium]
MQDDKTDLTTGNITKKLVKLSLPIMLSNLMMTLYNLVDAFWLGKTGSSAAGAVSVVGLTFPIVFFLISFGSGFTVAGTSLIAQYKGAKNEGNIKKVIGQFVTILFVFTIFFILINELLLEPILKLLNTPTAIFDIAKKYVHIILYGMIFMFVFFTYQSISQGFGDTVSPMKIQVITITLNIILDPLLIFGIGIFPKMGVVGAGIATLFARALAALIAIIFFYKKYNKFIPSLKDIIPIKSILKKIMNISIPASLAQSATSLGFVLLQGFVNTYGVTVISAYTIGNRMIGLFMMPAMGISRGLSSMIGQNLGAKKISRAKSSVRIAFYLIFTIMTLGCAGLFFFGEQLTVFFINDPKIIAIGGRMFKIVAFAANIFGIMFVFNGVFNGSGHTKSAMFYNMARLWLFRIPLVFLLSGKIIEITFLKSSFLLPFFQAVALEQNTYEALWWSMLISNILSTIWAYAVYKKGDWQVAKIYT